MREGYAMNNKLFNSLIFSGMFAAICYSIVVFYVNTGLALALAAFTFFSFFIVFFVYLKLYKKQYKGVDVNIENVRFRDSSNYYTDRLVGNGLLLLTNKSLHFIQKRRGEKIELEIPFERILRVSYDKIYKHISGIRIQTTDGTIVGFLTSKHKLFLDQYNFYLMNKDSGS